MAQLQYTALYPEHLLKLRPHPEQQDEYDAMVSHAALNNMETCTGLTAWAGGECLGMAGVFPLWPGRAEAWVLFSANANKFIHQAFPVFKMALDSMPYRRIEMNVKARNASGHKFARHLGFGGSLDVPLPNGKTVKAEGLLRSFWPRADGSADDVVVYSRIRTP